MLEAIREHAKGWIAKIILGLIALTFAFWGVDSYLGGSGQAEPAATVNGDEIGQSEYFDAVQQQREALQIKNASEADEKALRKQVIDQMVNTRLLVGAAQDAGLRITDAQAEVFLAGQEVFQENGKLSPAKLDAWLRGRGMSEDYFANMVRNDLLIRQVQSAYGEGAVVSNTSAQQLGRLLAQKREIQEVLFDINRYLNSVQVDDKAVEAEYNAHRQDYGTPAQVRVQYAVLSTDLLSSQIQIDEAVARQYYEQNQARYQEPEQRRAAHILIKIEPGTDAKARQAAQDKATRLLREVQANAARFAELARANSEDPVSGQQGGDLGAFTREMMVKPFADAVFSMKPGEIRGLVETEFGFHIIRLDGVIPGAKLGFDLVKGEILDELRKQEAQRHFAEAADRFSNLVYEQPDSLEPAAKELRLTLQESGWVSRKAAEPGFLAHPRLMEALFSEESLRGKHNTEAVEVAPNVLVAARVLEHRPEGTRPLQEVAAEIRLKLTAKAAREQAVAAGQQALKAAQAGQAPTGMGAPMTVSRMQPLNLPAEAIKAVFKADASRLPAYVGLDSREGYRLYRINRVIQGETGPDQVKLIRRDLQRLTAQEELRLFLEQARGQAKIRINQDVVEKKAD
ncbi:MAG: SurA N-terminal domain-containing protein [Thiobacillaceae bacterium]|nr:SurA N-terminal domain-containing protein [Thiobacillaceae bacterium]